MTSYSPSRPDSPLGSLGFRGLGLRVEAGFRGLGGILGGSWLVISRVISRVTIVITYIRGLITPLITTHEPPSRIPLLGPARCWQGPVEKFIAGDGPATCYNLRYIP